MTEFKFTADIAVEYRHGASTTLASHNTNDFLDFVNWVSESTKYFEKHVKLFPEHTYEWVALHVFTNVGNHMTYLNTD